MVTLEILLDEFVLDVEKPVLLRQLPKEEAKELIKNAFSFMLKSFDVEIRQDTAYITIHCTPENLRNAKRLYDRGSEYAQAGNYKKAISILEKAAEEAPAQVDIRRDLAMAYLESGNKERAKQYLLYALRIDPRDAWSYMLLGNIYAKHENSFTAAEQLYKKAYELNPDDPYLLTNLGAMSVESNKNKIAQDYFTRAIEIDSSYPNAYYGLALLYTKSDRLEDAVRTLEELFAKPRSDDSRLWPVYAQARALYLDVNKKIVEHSYAALMNTLETRKQRIEQESGVHIEVVEDNSLKSIFAVAESARRHNRDTHVIRYRNINRQITPHLVAHELEHLYMEEQARAVGRNRFFATTAKTREHAVRSVADYVFKQQQKGHSSESITEVTLSLINGLANQLHSCPLDMMVEFRLHRDLEALRPSQFLSLVYNHTQSIKTITSREIKKNSPRQIFQASVTLNYAYALFCDSLYPNAANFAELYQNSSLPSKIDSVAHALFDAWQQTIQSFHPGDEYALVDQFASMLKLEDWFEWKTDNSQQPQPEGPTNPELLKEQEPAIVMYCLGALQHFQDMDKENIFAVGSEIALLGKDGLDYSSPDKSYTLKSIPNVKFTGLQLLCYMYVAFQITDPSLDLGLDFKEAYTTALMLYSKNNA